MPWITLTEPKYPLTESEKQWLEKREKWNSKSGYYLTPWNFPNKTLYRMTEYADYKDSAEFNARVAARLTGLKAEELPCYPNRLCPYSAKHIGSCKACYLKHARIAVEQEMEEEGK